jgi:hypothetical protein
LKALNLESFVVGAMRSNEKRSNAGHLFDFGGNGIASVNVELAPS